ncbi:MAG: hypothetical protein WAO20_06920 [Acidobacteriota bacterium]
MLAAGLLASLCTTATAGLVVSDLGKSYDPDMHRVVARQSQVDLSGNTSVRNVDAGHLKWKEAGYFQRNRDLGQVFIADRDFRLDAIVLRTGPAPSAVLSGAPGARVFVQFFEVLGTPEVEDNGTPPGTDASHGFSTNHRCDDYLSGVRYRPMRTVRGGVFPDLPPTRDFNGSPTGDSAGVLRYLRWDFTGDDALEFQAGSRYAFVVGFETPGPERGFTLANRNTASVDAPPALGDSHDAYLGGWAVRREGDGTLPPFMYPSPVPPREAGLRQRLVGESMFESGEERFSLSPTTAGYPDVDTYRDYEFYLEASAEQEADGSGRRIPLLAPEGARFRQPGGNPKPRPGCATQ